MAQYTKNLNLEKPDYGEYYDVGIFNENADKIDKGIEDSENRSTQRLEIHKDSDDHTADKIRYDGKIAKDNVKDALDETDTRIDNIVSQGGSDNTEVVDARHSTIKNKTFDVLKDRLEDNESDLVKVNEQINSVKDVELSTYSDVISVPDSAVAGHVEGVLKGKTFTNLIKNGDFSDGSEHWYLNNSQAKIEDGVLRINTSSGFHVKQDLSIFANHKYYVSFYSKNDGFAQLYFIFRNFNEDGSYSDSSGFKTNANSNWQRESGIIEADDFYNSFTILRSGTADSYIEIDNILLVDITATFGEGNEPTKEECDEIFADWFDGTKSTNLIKNGSFDNATNWNTSQPTHVQIEDGVLKINTEIAFYIWQEVTIKANHKYYIAVSTKNDGTAQVIIYFGKTDNTSASELFKTNADPNWKRESVILVANNNGSKLSIVRHTKSDNVIELDDFVLIDLTETFGAGNEPTKETCDKIFANYFDNTKSTVGSFRLKSVGKNLFDLAGGELNQVFRVSPSINVENNSIDGGWAATHTQKIYLEPNTVYTLSATQAGTELGGVRVFLYNQIGKKTNSPLLKSNLQSRSSRTFTTPNDIFYGQVRIDNGEVVPGAQLKNIQLERGDTATEYEPYIEDRAYITAEKDGEILELRSLPNGVRDEIDLSDSKCIKRIGQKENVGAETVIDYDDMAENGVYYAWNDDNETETGIYGDTLGIDNATLIYQLAEPEIIPIRWTGLQAYENGTVYVDTVIPELGFYYNNGLESHYPDHPIKEVDTLYRVDKETGYKEALDVSKCEIREDRLSFTHPDLVDGDLCDWDYVPITESTRPEVTFKFPTNIKASVNSLLDAEQRNSRERRIIEQKATDAMEQAKTATDKADMANNEIRNHMLVSNPHNITKYTIGLDQVINVRQMPESGGEFTGRVLAYTGEPYELQIRNIIILDEDTQDIIIDDAKANMGEGDIIMYYKNEV